MLILKKQDKIEISFINVRFNDNRINDKIHTK